MKSPLPYLLAVLLCALACGGCARSERPLSAVDESKPDPRLAGMWRIVEGDDDYQDRVVRVTFKDNVGLLHLFGEDRGWKPIERVEGFTVTRTAKASYLSVLMYDDDPKEPNASKAQHFVFLRYKVSDDGENLTYWRIDDNYFIRAVQAGKLKGENKDGGVPNAAEGVYLKDTSENLLRFVDSLPEGAFPTSVKAVKLSIKVK